VLDLDLESVTLIRFVWTSKGSLLPVTETRFISIMEAWGAMFSTYLSLDADAPKQQQGKKCGASARIEFERAKISAGPAVNFSSLERSSHRAKQRD